MAYAKGVIIIESQELCLLFEIYDADQLELDEQHTRPDEKLTLDFKLEPRDDASNVKCTSIGEIQNCPGRTVTNILIFHEM